MLEALDSAVPEERAAIVTALRAATDDPAIISLPSRLVAAGSLTAVARADVPALLESARNLPVGSDRSGVDSDAEAPPEPSAPQSAVIPATRLMMPDRVLHDRVSRRFPLGRRALNFTVAGASLSLAPGWAIGAEITGHLGGTLNADAEFGPVMVREIRVIGRNGHAELHVAARARLRLVLSGGLRGSLRIPGADELISVAGRITGTGQLSAHSASVVELDVIADGGALTLAGAVRIPIEVTGGVRADASLSGAAFGAPLFRREWHLGGAQNTIRFGAEAGFGVRLTRGREHGLHLEFTADAFPLESIERSLVSATTVSGGGGDRGSPDGVAPPNQGELDEAEGRRPSADRELDNEIAQSYEAFRALGAAAGGRAAGVMAQATNGFRTAASGSRDPELIARIEDKCAEYRLRVVGNQAHHAEKKMLMQWDGPFGVNRSVCDETGSPPGSAHCDAFLRAWANESGRRRVVTDPRGVWIYPADGGAPARREFPAQR
ncbi:hypothetical protein [Amycolatopsis sp. NPDC051102]|uniref:hypothetical protein n=1 Tax=Amycolatopsis sp. NPDC051102 TaxID=3155163 RepID=UPI003448BD50